MTKNEPIIYVSNIISGYNIARSYYTDILFQHGVDKIFYYGNALGDDDKNCSFIYYLPKQNGTFGLHKNDYQLYDPINIVNLGCEIYAHVDLNYDYYMTILNEKYKKTFNIDEKKIVSRIIGLFKPYKIVEVPVLNVNSVKTNILSKNLKKKILDLNKFIEEIKNTSSYKHYQYSLAKIGKSENLPATYNQIEERKKILGDLISTAKTISKSLGSLLKIMEVVAYYLDDKRRQKNEFNPLLLNMDFYHTQAAVSALDSIILK